MYVLLWTHTQNKQINDKLFLRQVMWNPNCARRGASLTASTGVINVCQRHNGMLIRSGWHVATLSTVKQDAPPNLCKYLTTRWIKFWWAQNRCSYSLQPDVTFNVESQNHLHAGTSSSHLVTEAARQINCFDDCVYLKAAVTHFVKIHQMYKSFIAVCLLTY